MLKYIFATVLTLAIIGFTFITTIITVLNTGQEFWLMLGVIIGGGSIVFTNILILKGSNRKPIVVSFLTFTALSIVVVGSIVGYGVYKDSLKVMSKQDVDLREYEPFKEINLLATLPTTSSYAMEEPLLKLDGSTALYPIYAAFVQAVYPEGTYTYPTNTYVTSSQTSGAWTRLLDGRADVIFVPESPQYVKEQVDQQNLTLKETPIGKEAFVFFVHHKNPVENLSMEEMKKIYSGEIKNWKEVGGKDEKILAFQRPEDSGSQQALMKFMGDTRIMKAPSEQITSGMGGIIENIAEYENNDHSIGFSFRFFSQEMVKNGKIKHVSINGVSPTVENIQNGTYPMVSEFYAVTLKEKSTEKMQEFINWMTSSEGQQLIEQTGYVPVNN